MAVSDGKAKFQLNTISESDRLQRSVSTVLVNLTNQHCSLQVIRANNFSTLYTVHVNMSCIHIVSLPAVQDILLLVSFPVRTILLLRQLKLVGGF